MSESIQGVVSKVSRKNGRGAILFESSDIWYGAFSGEIGKTLRLKTKLMVMFLLCRTSRLLIRL